MCRRVTHSPTNSDRITYNYNNTQRTHPKVSSAYFATGLISNKIVTNTLWKHVRHTEIILIARKQCDCTEQTIHADIGIALSHLESDRLPAGKRFRTLAHRCRTHFSSRSERSECSEFPAQRQQTERYITHRIVCCPDLGPSDACERRPHGIATQFNRLH